MIDNIYLLKMLYVLKIYFLEIMYKMFIKKLFYFCRVKMIQEYFFKVLLRFMQKVFVENF